MDLDQETLAWLVSIWCDTLFEPVVGRGGELVQIDVVVKGGRANIQRRRDGWGGREHPHGAGVKDIYSVRSYSPTAHLQQPVEALVGVPPRSRSPECANICAGCGR